MPSIAQQRKVDRADKKYSNLAFMDAQKLYLKIVENGNETQEILQKLADTYYFNDDLQESNVWYSKLFEKYSDSIEPEYYFRHAQSLKSVSKYDEANALLDQLGSIEGAGGLAEIYKSQPDYARIIDMQSGRFTIENAREINSFTADMGPSYYGNKVVFATARDTGSFIKRVHDWNEQAFLQLYVANANLDGTLFDLERFNSNLNSDWHESTATFTVDGDAVYFTRNNSQDGKLLEDEDGFTKLKIYRSIKTEDGWSNPESVSINDDAYNTAHPALSPDGTKLFFVSDREGSVGYDVDEEFTRSDIWVADVAADGSLSNPRNLTSINTHGRETFPFVSKNNVLYFASTGHSGLGGLDVFSSKIYEDGSMGTVVNVGRPINTSFDDFGFIIDTDTNLGYFTSNRSGGMGGDDIYRFTRIEEKTPCEVLLEGIVTEERSGKPLSDVTVTVVDRNNNQVDTAVTDAQGAYQLKVNCDMQYFIRASKDNYTRTEQLFNTPAESKTMTMSLSLIDPSIPVLECDDLAEILDIEQIYFDFDKSFIRNDAAEELAKIQAFLELYPQTKIDIRSHTDSRADDAYNMALSERRAQSTRSWLIDKGIDASRITAKGYGESQLVNNCSNGVACTAAQHQLNRRSEFIVTGLDNYADCD